MLQQSSKVGIDDMSFTTFLIAINKQQLSVYECSDSCRIWSCITNKEPINYFIQ